MDKTLLGVTFEAVMYVPRPRGFYSKILDAFLEQEHPVVKVTVEGRTGDQVSKSLRQTLRELDRYKGLAQVYQRDGETYLEKTGVLQGE